MYSLFWTFIRAGRVGQQHLGAAGPQFHASYGYHIGNPPATAAAIFGPRRLKRAVTDRYLKQANAVYEVGLCFLNNVYFAQRLMGVIS